jgi:hypothetical protein
VGEETNCSSLDHGNNGLKHGKGHGQLNRKACE